MIEAIFVDSNNIEGIENSGANYLMVAQNGLTLENWEKLKNLGMDLSIAVTAFDQGSCPVNPESQRKLISRIQKASEFRPVAIWLDHFRFDGHWEAGRGNKIPGIHQDCQYCTGIDRVDYLEDIALKVVNTTKGVKRIGYFAVPFKDDKVPEMVTNLGQDHKRIGRVFDQSSPMLYHRMIGKPVGYISEYVKWMRETTGKPVLPIIQIKDMPDDLHDDMTESDIKEAFDEAKKEPSVGVAIFWWQHALEKKKTAIVSKLLH